MVKKLSFAISALSLAASVNISAAFPNGYKFNCCANVPSYCGGLRFAIEGLYLKPSWPYGDYALKYPFNPTVISPNGVVIEDGVYHSVDPDYELGYHASLGYVFPCTANGINLAYSHLRESDKNVVLDKTNFGLFSSFFSGGSNNIGVTDVSLVFPDAGSLVVPVTLAVPINRASMSVNFDYDVWDLDFGQDVLLGCRFKFHWFGGLRYGRLDESLSAQYEGENIGRISAGTIGAIGAATATSSFNLHQRSDYHGIGPRLGTHVTYQFQHFGIDAELSGSLLVGEIDSSYRDLLHQFVSGTLVAVSPGATPIFSDPLIIDSVFSFKHNNETRVVPNLEGKLGINYAYQLCDRTRTLIKFDAGWMITHYFNAFERLSAVGANEPEVRTRHTSNLDFQGPYFGILVNL